jgi:hypothetical protein
MISGVALAPAPGARECEARAPGAAHARGGVCGRVKEWAKKKKTHDKKQLLLKEAECVRVKTAVHMLHNSRLGLRSRTGVKSGDAYSHAIL